MKERQGKKKEEQKRDLEVPSQSKLVFKEQSES